MAALLSLSWKELPRMARAARTVRLIIVLSLSCAAAWAQVSIAGRVVDENGAGISGARVELRAAAGTAVIVSSDPAGNFRASLAAVGEYAVRVERLGFFLYTNRAQEFEPGANQLTIRLNHLQ